MYIHKSLCSWHASSFTNCTYVNLIYRVCFFACAHVWIRDEPSQRPTPPLYHHHHQPTMPRLDLPSTKSTESSMQRDVPTTNWCRLANAKCYILCLQALAISKARLCDAVEMHTRNLYRNSKSILERLFSIARLGSQTTMTSSIAPKHMSMHNRRRMGRSEGSIFFQTQPLILVSSERSFASCGNKQARSNPTTKMEKAMFFPDFSRCFNRTHNKTTHNTRSPRAPERSV